MSDAGWTELKIVSSSDGRRKVIILGSRDGYFRYEALRWQKYYNPSPEDDHGPVEGGLWSAEYVSGLHATSDDAENDARTAVQWLGQMNQE